MTSAEHTPGTAMDTGSDAGEPGDRVAPAPLDAAEQRLLEELRSGSGTTDADPDADAEARAARDDSPLPAPGGDPQDGLSAEFTAPGD